jgi:phytoene dehydrogenase-like protein
MESKHDMIIIGGGVGGLACAALLTKQGFKPLLLEMNASTGGRVLGATEKGFTYEYFPIGVTPVRGHSFEALAKELGLNESEFKIIGPKNMTFAYRGRSKKWKFMDNVDIMLGDISENFDPSHLFELWGLNEKEQDQAVQVLGEMYLMTPDQIAALDVEDITFKEYLDQGHYEIPWAVYNFFGFFANMAMVEPFDLVSAAEYIRILQDSFNRGGGGYPVGGCMRVVEVLTRKFTDLGGVVRTQTKVDRISVENGSVTGVITTDGEEIKAPVVISNAGIHPTVLKLVGEEHFDKSYVNYVKDLVPAWGLTSQIYFLSKPVLDFGISVIYSDTGWWNLERYRKVKNGHIPDDVIVYAMVPSNYDPNVVPAGKQILTAGTVCPSDPDAKGIEMLTNKAESLLFEFLPEIVPANEFKKYSGPSQVSALTRDHVQHGQGGECMGLGQIVGQCGSLKPSARTSVGGLFLVGIDAGGSTGMGLHQSVDSAIKVSRTVGRYCRMRRAVI